MSLASLLGDAPIRTLVIAGGGLVTIGMLGLAVALGLKAKKPPGEKPAAPTALAVPPPAESLAPSANAARAAPAALRQLLGQLRRLAAPDDARYAAPWILVAGETDADVPGLVAAAGLAPLFPGEAPAALAARACVIHPYARGVVVELAGEVISGDPRASVADEWRRFLRRLQWSRHLRPLDGVVLALPCDALLAETRAQWTARGERFSRFLNELLRETGLSLPVYVVITRCEALPGFQSFWNERELLVETSRDELVGWTNPDLSDAPYRVGLGETALARTAEAFRRRFAEVAASRENARAIGEAWHLPDQIVRLTGALGPVLDHAFARNAFEDQHRLRGLYLSGAMTGAERPAFARDLFEQRVMPELGFARASRAAVLGRTRAIRSLQYASLALAPFFALALWYAGHAAADISELIVAALRPPAASDAMHTVDGRARRIITTFARFERNNLIFPALPSSWFSHLDARAVRALEGAARRDLVLPIGEKLRARYEDFADDRSRLDAAAPAETSDWSGVRVASDFAARLAGIAKDSLAYRRLAKLDINEVGDLLHSVFEIDIGSDFTHHSGLYARAIRLAAIDEADFSALNRNAFAFHRALVDAIARRFAAGGRAEAPFVEFERAANDFAASDGSSESARKLGARFALALSHIDSVLSNPEFRWTTLDDVAADPRIAAWLDNLARARDQAPSMADVNPADETRDALNGAIGDFRRRVTALKDGRNQPIFMLGGQNRREIQLAPPYARIAAALRPLMARSFMRAEFADRSAGADPNRVPTWSHEALDRVMAIYRDYEKAKAQDLPAFPPEYSGAFELFVHEQASIALAGAILAARIWELPPHGESVDDESALSLEAASLDGARDLLIDLRAVLQQERLVEAYDVFKRETRLEIGSLLRRVDSLVTREALYLPADEFRSWTGETSPTFASYGAETDAALAGLAESWRDRLDAIATNFARPAVAFISASSADDPARDATYERWRATLAELRQFRAKNPASSPAQLERFLRIDLAALRPDACATLPPPDEERSDVFSRRLETIRREIRDRCFELQSRSLDGDYGRLAGRFNASLAGRFPFAEPTASAPDADPEAIADFYRLLDDVEPRLRPALSARLAVDRGVQPALAFLDKLDSDRALLAPLVAADAKPRAVELTVAFRVNRARERGGNQIIDWSLEIGDQQIRRDLAQPEGAPSTPAGFWSPGEPVTLVLRWAKDGPTAPLAAPPPGPDVEDLVARFGFTGRWSLLRMLARHRAAASEFERGVDPTPATLGFTIPIAARGEGSSARPPVRAFVQVALAVHGADAKPNAKLAAPDFPFVAPALGAARASKGSQKWASTPN